MLNTMPTAEIVHEIRLLQNIQKCHHHTHPEWQKASERLHERFAEMSRREKAGEPEAVAARV